MRQLKSSVFRIVFCSIILMISIFIIPNLSETYAIQTNQEDIQIEELSSGIHLQNAYPTKDEDGIKQIGYRFMVKCNELKTFTLSFQNDLSKELPRLENENLRYIVFKNNQAFTSCQTLEEDGFILEDTISEDTLYEIRMWIKRDATNEIMGKYFSGKIVLF